MGIENQIVQTAIYDRGGSLESFKECIETLIERMKTDRPDALIRYSFYTETNNNTATAVMVYRDAEAWLDLHEHINALPEYREFLKSVTLRELRFYGELTPKIRRFLNERSIQFTQFAAFAVGFAG